jgi:hypothetical protein
MWCSSSTAEQPNRHFPPITIPLPFFNRDLFRHSQLARPRVQLHGGSVGQCCLVINVGWWAIGLVIKPSSSQVRPVTNIHRFTVFTSPIYRTRYLRAERWGLIDGTIAGDCRIWCRGSSSFFLPLFASSVRCFPSRPQHTC